MHDFNAMVRGEIHRRQVMQDLFGRLRLDVLVAGGVTFSLHPQPPKPTAPTFEKIMGREPVPFFPGQKRRAVEEPEVSESAQRAMGMISVAGVRKAKQPRPKKASPRTPELEP